jgi:FkbM family methyltransferase
MANRFDGMDDALAHLRRRGFSPGTVIDIGANIGQWSQKAFRHFPAATYHLIEPQVSCAHALHAFATEHPSVNVHTVAVSRPEVKSVKLVGEGTGAFLGTLEGTECRVTTLDALLPRSAEPFLLKLDIQGHELEALAGAEVTLKRAAVVITEVSFFPIGVDQGRAAPSFADYFSFFHGAGFTLYDIAALGGRSRDERLVQGDCVFVRNEHLLLRDTRWD